MNILKIFWDFSFFNKNSLIGHSIRKVLNYKYIQIIPNKGRVLLVKDDMSEDHNGIILFLIIIHNKGVFGNKL